MIHFKNIIFIVFAVFMIWQSGAVDRFLVSSLSANQAKETISQKNPILIDVREWDEIKDGMLKGAQWLPLSAIQAKDEAALKAIDRLDTKREIWVYCRSGSRSAKVAKLLKEKKFEVFNIGGFSVLQNAGFEVVTPKAKPQF